MIVLVSILLLLVTMFVLDIKSRFLPLWAFPVLMMLLFLFYNSHSWKIYLFNSIVNGSVLLLMFFSLKFYFYFKNGQRTKIINEYLGLGDVFFLLGICLFFSPFNYILFILISMLLAITFHLFTKSKQDIPMASYFSFLLGILLIIDYVFLEYSIINDDYLLNLLYYGTYSQW